jgi:surface antigen
MTQGALRIGLGSRLADRIGLALGLLGLLSAGVLPGCVADPYGRPVVSQNQVTGSLVGGLTGAAVGYQVGKGSHHKDRGALVGGLVGALAGGWLGGQLDRYDRRYAQPAYFSAFEEAPYGSSVSWRNPDTGHYGTVTPTRSYDRDGSQCRDYSQRIVIDGRSETGYGTACRQADGSWQIVN